MSYGETLWGCEVKEILENKDYEKLRNNRITLYRFLHIVDNVIVLSNWATENREEFMKRGYIILDYDSRERIF